MSAFTYSVHVGGTVAWVVARVQRQENCAGGRREEGALRGFSGELAVKMEERETLRMEPSF